MGSTASSLTPEAQAKLASEIKETYESKSSSLDSKSMYKEIASMIDLASSGTVAESKEGGGMEEEKSSEGKVDEGDDQVGSMVVRPPIIKKNTRRLSQQLKSHLVMSDNEINFKIGDVVKAVPEGEQMKFEGICVAIDEQLKLMLIDFGDGEEPSEVPVSTVQRIQNGSNLEVDDIVQAKPPGTPMFVLGRVSKINDDGTYDIAYDGCDEVDENVEMKYVRKVGSGRSSGFKKIKKAVKVFSAVRAFGGGAGGLFGGKGMLSKTAPGKLGEEKQ